MNKPYPLGFDYTLDLGDLGEHDFRIEGIFTPELPGRDYLPNGDPGYPPESSTFEVHSVKMLPPVGRLSVYQQNAYKHYAEMDFYFLCPADMEDEFLERARNVAAGGWPC